MSHFAKNFENDSCSNIAQKQCAGNEFCAIELKAIVFSEIKMHILFFKYIFHTQKLPIGNVNSSY